MQVWPVEQPESRRGPIQIKRYANRKLYDLSARRYVTLDGVGALVEQGHDICVTDNRTGQDVTVLVLSQIIVEQAKSRPESLSEALLSGLIRAPGDILALVGRMASAPVDLLAVRKEGLLAATKGEGQGQLHALYDSLHLATREDVNRLTRQVDDLLAKLDALDGQAEVPS